MSHCLGTPIALPIERASHRLDQMAIERLAMAGRALSCWQCMATPRPLHAHIWRPLSALFCASIELFFAPHCVGRAR